jgi:nuclear mRNA export protein SAC3
MDQSAPSVLKVNSSDASTRKSVFSNAEAKVKEVQFSARSVIVKECFAKWRKRTSDRVEYLEAVRRSDEYSKRVQQNRMLSESASSSVSGSDRKRRISEITPELIQKKRARKRASGQYVAPRTDDDLVRRLKEVLQLFVILGYRVTYSSNRIMRSMSADGLRVRS